MCRTQDNVSNHVGLLLQNTNQKKDYNLISYPNPEDVPAVVDVPVSVISAVIPSKDLYNCTEIQNNYSVTEPQIFKHYF